MDAAAAYLKIKIEEMSLLDISRERVLVGTGFWTGTTRRHHGRILIDGVEHTFREPATEACACGAEIPMIRARGKKPYIDPRRVVVAGRARHALDVCERCTAAARRGLCDWTPPAMTDEERRELHRERKVHDYPR